VIAPSSAMRVQLCSSALSPYRLGGGTLDVDLGYHAGHRTLAVSRFNTE
jgi:hypothetical protein